MPWGSLSRCVAFDLFFPWAFDCDIYGQYVLEKETILFIFSPEWGDSTLFDPFFCPQGGDISQKFFLKLKCSTSAQVLSIWSPSSLTLIGT